MNKTKNQHEYVAIMAGGIGSRFWPLSRTEFPKQFIDVLGIGRTFLQITFDRSLKIVPLENIYIVTSEMYVDIVKKQLPEITDKQILCEPSRKNTAACIAYISYKLYQKDKEALLLCAPADHLILDDEAFAENCKKAFEFSKHLKALVTLGITPTSPNTGYGYIQFDYPPVDKEIHKVKLFTEKPNKEMAQTFIDSGDFLWNSGIFIGKTETIIKSFELHQPEMFDAFEMLKDKFNTNEEQEAIKTIYPQCVNISIDYAIMEKANNVYVIQAKFKWSDLGTWSSAYENLEKDYFGNAVVGKEVMVIDAKNNVVHSQGNKLIVLQGLNDYIIVDTKDVLLIAKKEMEQDIKDYVSEIKKNKGEKYI